MKSIKFKVWDKKNKKWIDDCDIAINQKGLLFIRYEGQVSFNPMSLTKSSNFIIVFYTGLLDKNKKEIYGGDIVKTQYTNSEGIREIKYNIRNNFSGFGYIQNLNTSEVIGNIYENPNLIKN